MAKSKTVIVTGASRGIGRKIAELFAVNGYNVLINYHRSENEARNFYKTLRTKGLSVALYQADVADRKQVDNMIRFCLAQFDTVDVLINNAGISQSKMFIDITEDDWENMVKNNFNSVFHCTQSVVRYMISKKQGKIINISSIWGMVGAACEVHYSAVKAGIIGFTKALAKELGPLHIQVNCIAPGIIQTDMLKDFTTEDLEMLSNNTPLMRLGTVDDVAQCALFLASDKADFITGQVMSPNGGFVI